MALTRLCIDTSAYSHFMRQDPPAVEALRRARWLGLPVIVVGELRYGFRMGSRAEENERLLAAFKANPVVEMLEVDEVAAELYAEICAELRTSGTPLPTNDVWIAAVAAREGATVLTYDPHFRRIPRVGSRLLGTEKGG